MDMMAAQAAVMFAQPRFHTKRRESGAGLRQPGSGNDAEPISAVQA